MNWSVYSTEQLSGVIMCLDSIVSELFAKMQETRNGDQSWLPLNDLLGEACDEMEERLKQER